MPEITFYDPVAEFPNRRRMTVVEDAGPFVEGDEIVVDMAREVGTENRDGMITAASLNQAFKDVVWNAFDTLYPVGSIYMSVDSCHPNTIWAGSRWETWGVGKNLQPYITCYMWKRIA